VIRHLEEARPHEGVGLLAVKPSPLLGPLAVVRFYPGTNTLHAANRFAMDGHEVLSALRDIREHGWTLGAIVHSHLAGPATPSPTDLREAHYPQALMLIVSFAGQATDVRAWRIGMTASPEIFLEVPVVRWGSGGRMRNLD
jgi:proteasome lid subunit RPN8/RPN11